MEYYYNVETASVEEGKQSDGSHLLGPYPTREEAERALAKVRENNERWDAEDKAYYGEDD